MLAAVAELEHVRTHRVPAASGTPQLRGLEDRRDDLERARAVHFLADNLLNLLERAHPEGEICVEPACDLARETRADKELVRVDFCVAGILPERLDERLGPFHDWDIIPNPAALLHDRLAKRKGGNMV